MASGRFDQISKLLVERRLTRRQAVVTGAGTVTAGLVGTGLAAAQDAGAVSTPDFLEGLGFSEENPPYAALIVETGPGRTDITVVGLFNPTYDPVGSGVTYDVEVLQNWQNDLELGFRDEPADLAALAANVGSAHLLIDDCPENTTVACRRPGDEIDADNIPVFTYIDSCWNSFVCEPYYHKTRAAAPRTSSGPTGATPCSHGAAGNAKPPSPTGSRTARVCNCRQRRRSSAWT